MHIGAAAVVERGGIYTLDGLVEHAEHLVTVLDIRDHICRVDSCKRLIVTVFQFRAGTYGKRVVRSCHIDLQLGNQGLRKAGRHELGQDLVISQFRINDILKSILLDELVEILRRNDYASRN